MDVFDAIDARRTVHLYEPSQIEEAELERALELALTAPNHKFTFPWKFVVVGPETRRSLKEIAAQIKRSKRDTPISEETAARLDEKLTQKMINPAALVAFYCQRNDDYFRQREDYASVCCAIQNFTVALAGMGYGSKWSSGGVTTAAETYQLLNVNQERYENVGFVWVGHGLTETPPRRRPPLEAFLSTLP